MRFGAQPQFRPCNSIVFHPEECMSGREGKQWICPYWFSVAPQAVHCISPFFSQVPHRTRVCFERQDTTAFYAQSPQNTGRVNTGIKAKMSTWLEEDHLGLFLAHTFLRTPRKAVKCYHGKGKQDELKVCVFVLRSPGWLVGWLSPELLWDCKRC